MTKETLKSKSQKASKDLLHTFDLPSLIDKMRTKQSYAKGDFASMILHKNPSKQIVLTALHEDTQISSFQSNDSITFQIIEGTLLFNAKTKSICLKKGQLLMLHDKIQYSMLTSEESVILLTIAHDNEKKTGV